MRDFLNVLERQDLNSVTRELRLITMQERMEDGCALDEAKQSEVKERKEILMIASLFLQKNQSQLPINFQAAYVYSDLAAWLYEQRESNAIAASLSVAAWQLHLDRYISPCSNLKILLPLGVVFFEAPFQIAGFITYMLEKGVTPVDIEQSKLLHLYFEVEGGLSLEDLQEMYALLPDREAVRVLKAYFSCLPVTIFAFLNANLPQDQRTSEYQYQSYNVMGEQFKHLEKFELQESVRYQKKSICFEGYSSNEIASLFTLFGWHLISSLDLESEDADFVVKVLLQTHFEAITQALPALALTNEISHDIAEYIVRKSAEILAPDHLDVIESLMQKSPFYLHLYTFLDQEYQVLEADRLIAHIEEMLANKQYLDPRHLLFLANLSNFLDKQDGFLAISIKLKEAIFQLVLTHDDLMQNEQIESVIALDGLTDLVFNEIQKYHQKVFSCIDRYIQNEADFRDVIIMWESCLRHANVFHEIDPQLKFKTNYPFTTYALRARVIEKFWENARSKNIDFSLDHLIPQLVIDVNMETEVARAQADQKRIVQEALIYIRDKQLIEILKWWATTLPEYSENAFYQIPFGDDDCLLEKAILEYNEELFKSALPHIKWNSDLLYRVIFELMSTKQVSWITYLSEVLRNREYFVYVLESFYFNESADDQEQAYDWDSETTSQLLATICAQRILGAQFIQNTKLFGLTLRKVISEGHESALLALVQLVVNIRTLKKFVSYHKILLRHLEQDNLQALIDSVSMDRASKTVQRYLQSYYSDEVTSSSDSETSSEDEDKAILRDSMIGNKTHRESVMRQVTQEDKVDMQTQTTPVAGPLQTVFIDEEDDEFRLPVVAPQPLAAMPVQPKFTYIDYFKMAQNEHYRYAPNAVKVGYVLEKIADRNMRTTTVAQLPKNIFRRPDGLIMEGDLVPEVVQVSKCDPVWLPNGKMGLRARDDKGEEMIARRQYHFSIGIGDEPDEDYTFYPVSPRGQRSYFEGPMPLASKFNASEAGQALRFSAAQIHRTKSGDELIVNQKDIQVRAGQTRNPDQETTLGKKGIQVYQECFDQYGDALDPQLAGMLHHSANVMHLQTLRAKDRRGEPVPPEIRESVYRDKLLRTELLHRHSFTLHRLFSYLFIYKGHIYRLASKNLDKHDDQRRMLPEKDDIENKAKAIKEKVDATGAHENALPLTDPLYQESSVMELFADVHAVNKGIVIEDPLYINPQRKDNLGAARACHNTDMMVLERTVKWFALNVVNALGKENCHYDMFLDTDVIEKIHFVVMITFHHVRIRVTQEIDALEINPQIPKASDLAGLIGTLVQLVQGVVPSSVENTRILPDVNALSRPRISLFQLDNRKRPREEDVQAHARSPEDNSATAIHQAASF